MLKFFRRIRRNLIEAGSVKKYMFYAIGEILLVVIGILIALQINNWNEQQKLKRYEGKMLKEIHTSLQQDYDRLSETHSTLIRQVNANDSILKFIKDKDQNLAKLEGLFSFTVLSLSINFQTSGFESIKSKGLDIMSNDSLRIKLSNLYEYTYKLILDQNFGYQNHLRNKWSPFLDDNFQYRLVNNGTIRRPINWRKLVNPESKMENFLVRNRIIAYWLAKRLQSTLVEIENLLEDIDDYLKA